MLGRVGREVGWGKMCHWEVCFAAFACSCHLLRLSVAASAVQHIMKHSTCDTFTLQVMQPLRACNSSSSRCSNSDTKDSYSHTDTL